MKRGGTTLRARITERSQLRATYHSESRISRGSSVARIRQRLSLVSRSLAGRGFTTSGNAQDPERPGKGCLRYLLLSQIERSPHQETLKTKRNPEEGGYGTCYSTAALVGVTERLLLTCLLFRDFALLICEAALRGIGHSQSAGGWYKFLGA